MGKYLLVYYGGGTPASEEEQKKVMEAWSKWIDDCGDHMVDVGNPTMNGKKVTKDGTTDVSGNPVTGYSIINAPSLDGALHAAQMVPLVVDGSGSCEVYETMDVM